MGVNIAIQKTRKPSKQRKPHILDIALAFSAERTKMAKVKVRKIKPRYSVYAEFIYRNIRIKIMPENNVKVLIDHEAITLKFGFYGHKVVMKFLRDYGILGGSDYLWVCNKFQKLLQDLEVLYSEVSNKAFSDAEKYFTKSELELIKIVSNFRMIDFALGIQGVVREIEESSHQAVMDNLSKLFPQRVYYST